MQFALIWLYPQDKVDILTEKIKFGLGTPNFHCESINVEFTEKLLTKEADTLEWILIYHV